MNQAGTSNKNQGPIGAEGPDSVLSYFREHQFNPVLISVEDPTVWEDHFRKRQNLYERHLGLPLSLLKGRSVIEFGCNSGENALVLAAVGADLTLVEPNEQVIPRLKELFTNFGLFDRVVELSQDGIETFESTQGYDLVLAEGFLCQVAERDQLLTKLCDLLAPGGFGVISYNDRYGFLLEMTKRMVLWRACEISGVKDIHGEESLEMAGWLFGEDFARLSASRPFASWWKDNMVNPFMASDYFWSHPELLPIIESAGCEFYSSSPVWDQTSHFSWYKNVPENRQRRQDQMAEWTRAFTFVCTGIQPDSAQSIETPKEVIDAVKSLVTQASGYAQDYSVAATDLEYPEVLARFFAGVGDERINALNTELQEVFRVAALDDLEALLNTYQESRNLRNLWGTCYQYFCFTKPVGIPTRN